MVDNQLTKACGLSLHKGTQTMLYSLTSRKHIVQLITQTGISDYKYILLVFYGWNNLGEIMFEISLKIPFTLDNLAQG